MANRNIEDILKTHKKIRLSTEQADSFEKNLSDYMKLVNVAIDGKQPEEHLKNLFNDFLSKYFYKQENGYSINADGRTDSAIKKKDDLIALIEAKRPSNKNEMVSEQDINKKALWELTLYYLDKRYEMINSKAEKKADVQIRRLIITDAKQIFLIDAREFDKVVDKGIVNIYENFKNGHYPSKNNDEFYLNIKGYFADVDITSKLPFCSLNLEEIDKRKNRTLLQQVHQVLSPAFLVRETGQVAYKPNELNPKFYAELLYIMGLKEVKEKNKPVIIMDHSIKNSISNQLFTRFRVEKEFDEKKSFNLSLELSILWINRLLFIKLFEGQLIDINGDDKESQILCAEKVETLSHISKLFFEILGKQINDRKQDAFYDKFAQIPYLNSSLFERWEIEKKYANITDLRSDSSEAEITVFQKSVLGKSKSRMKLVEYILAFFNSYCFRSVVAEDDTISQGKDIIDAAVLGLIFEKINGYKDGAYFTPSAITEYMCKEVIERAVIQKINAVFDKKFATMEDTAYYTRRMGESRENLIKINEAINSLKICDPAVGSGHFLVSALNCLLEIKCRLGVLIKSDGNPFNEFVLAVENGVLAVRDGENTLFRYNKSNVLSQSVQEMLFNEKKTLIENCLFGVDINSKAVAICQLRLWIELLKSAYYNKDGIMEVLPNIDINIKCGNSLISKLPVQVGKSPMAKQMEKDEGKLFKEYKAAVKSYKSENKKATKDETVQKLKEFKAELHSHYLQTSLFPMGSETEQNLYENAFEWAIEFPEVLDETGKFLGFDIVIGNPPYLDSENMVKSGMTAMRDAIKKKYSYAKGNWDIYIAFFEQGKIMLSQKGSLCYLTPDKWISKPFGDAMRISLISNISSILVAGRDVFESALVDSIVTLITLDKCDNITVFEMQGKERLVERKREVKKSILTAPYALDIIFSEYISLIQKLQNNKVIGDYFLTENACATSDCYKLKDILFSLKTVDGFDENIHMKVINTGTIGRYLPRWGTQPMKYLKDKYQYPVVVKDEFLRHFPNSYGKKSVKPKVIIKGLTLLDCCIDFDGSIVPGKSTMIISANNNDLLYLAAILNSKLMIFFIKQKYSSSSYIGGINFTKDMINNLPFRKENDEGILAVAKNILKIKQDDYTADTSALEAEIDRLVYELYGLTEDEVKVVEGTA